jgi:YVTN family beta-propeller protein
MLLAKPAPDGPNAAGISQSSSRKLDSRLRPLIPSLRQIRPSTLYVANSESDSVSVVPAGAAGPERSINLSPYPGAPVGSNPDGLALAPDGRTLYVANSGDNDVDVISLPSGRIRGMIPTGWYATSVAVSGDGGTLFATSAKGLGAGPNPDGPNPYTDAQRRLTPGFLANYVGTMMKGTLSTIAVPDRATLER